MSFQTSAAQVSRVEEPWRQFLVGRSPSIERLAEKIRLIGPKRATVLITGETGTGKDITARALHAASPRAHLPLVAVNCTALPESLIEAELFGHVKGAFTGAVQSRAGRFEQANNSTLFLDEVGDLPVDTQAKLLRVLQEREFQRVGSSESISVDVRVIAATNADLQERIRLGRFREDLYYRLAVVPLALPPLRDRKEDIALLTAHFLTRICRQEGLTTPLIPVETLDWLCDHDWPGNIRQLENSLENAIALSGDRRILLPGDFHLPNTPRHMPPPEVTAVPQVPSLPSEGLDFEETINSLQLALIEQALRRSNGNKTLAASLLRLKRTTLSAKIRALAAAASV